jgi:hypothetical protein
MGLAWQQGPLATRSVGQFLVADQLPERLLFAEPLRRRMRVRFGGRWVVDSEDVDYRPNSQFRVVQLTPPGSSCSVQFGVGLSDAIPGSARNNYLVVTDIEVAYR